MFAGPICRDNTQIDKTENDMAHLREETQRLAGEIEALDDTRSEIDRQNERMKAAMRRCVTCDYRIEVVGRGQAAPSN